jgi:hypothetical protein
MNNLNNLNNILIAVFTILFCYILFYWLYKSCFGSKIIEGVDGDNSASATTTDTKTGPKVVTKESVKKEDEKKKTSSEDSVKQANEGNDKITSFNSNRKESNQKTPPSNELLQAKFT